MTQRIVILGGGPAGYEAALVAGELGADVTIIADEGLGGNSVLWDCVPSKALIVAAEAMGWIQTASRMGVHAKMTSKAEAGAEVAEATEAPGAEVAEATEAPGAEVAVDYPAVAASVLQLGRNQSRDIETRIEGSGVRVVRGRGRISGYHEVSATAEDGSVQTFPADYVLVATGSTARVLPFFAPDGNRVLTGQQVYDLDEVPDHLVVVGSGATGAEFAHAFIRFGARVTLVSSRDLILPTEDPDAAQVIEDVFERRGMTILRNARAVSCTPDDDGVSVGLQDGEVVRGSHVLFTVGQVPAGHDLGLEGADVDVQDWGAIDVDGVGRTSCRWIYAAGDVTGRVMLASVAAMQGRVAMWHALGQAVTPIKWSAVASTIFTDPEVAAVGLSADDADERAIPIVTARLDFRSNPRAKMTENVDGFVKVHAMKGSGTVVGGAVVAARASDLIQPLAVAVHNRLTVAQVAQTIAVYPSMQGSVAECARMLMAQLEE